MSVNPVSPVVFNGGQMTDLPVFTGTLNGSELMEVVAAGTGQSVVTEGVNYQIDTAQLSALLISLAQSSVIITDGQHTTPGDPYIPTPFIGRVYVNKSVAEPTYIHFDRATTYSVEPLVQDVAGTLDGVTGIITCTFTGGESANGITAIPIATPYGGYFFRPVGALNTWILGTA